MAAKPKRPPATTGKPTTARTTTKTTSTPSSSLLTLNRSNQLKDELGPLAGSTVASGDPDHRPSQPFAGAASLRPVHQSPNLNNGQPSQPPYSVQGVFSPQAGLQSPYVHNPPQYQQQHTSSDSTFYTANPSPRSTTSTAYYPTEKQEPMAAATATMQRPYPPIYHTPQSNSPASVTSPQSHDHGRPMYGQQPPQMTQSMYGYQSYQPLNSVPHSAYGGHQRSPMNSQSMLQSYPSNAHMQHQQMSAPQQTVASSPRMKTEGGQQYVHTPQSQPSILQRHSTAGSPTSSGIQTGQQTGPVSTSNAAPGPIPATTPLVVRQDNNGVQWIAFDYSRDRVKMEYIIRCDVETVDANNLSQEFKAENCVYPRACVPKDQYKGNRLAYETDCNQVGWALAQLNACLQGKRGLIQRAVDSWRNSNQDPRLRSRRVRRQAKLNNKSRIAPPASQTPGIMNTAPTGHPGPNSMAAPNSVRLPTTMPPGNQPIHHHHAQHEVSPTGQDSIGASGYSTTPNIHRSNSVSQHINSPHDLRQTHTFPGYQTYPSIPTTMGPSMAPPIQGMHQYGRSGGNTPMSVNQKEERYEKDQEDVELFGDIPEGKRRKFILVEDTQKNARVRVKVTLDQVAMSEIPDSYRKSNSVYPRAYYPVQLKSTSETTGGSRFFNEDVEDLDDAPPTIGRIAVPCQTSDGVDQVDIPQLSRAKRDRERKLNELGYRMAWGQSRVFSGRPVFLARALDAYRNKQRIALSSNGEDVSATPSHFITRPGKRRWVERANASTRAESPSAVSPV